MDIRPRELLDAIETGRAPLILDVRSRREYSRGHVPGAVHFPFWLLPLRRRHLTAGPGDPVVIYCGHGPRAWLAGAWLRRYGFRIAYLAGHMAGWRRAGLRESRRDA